LPGRGQAHAALGHLLAQEPVRQLQREPCAVGKLRIPADRATVIEVLQDRQSLLDDRMRLPALDVGNEADAAAVVFVSRVVQPLSL
jgi:hypothetical protein